MKLCLFAVLLLIITTSCDKNKVIRTPEEEHILELAYSDDYTFPTGFYRDVVETGSIYYENTVSIKSMSERDNIWIELSTNDKNEARLWSDKSNEYGSDNRELISESETNKYFEFKRKNREFARDILYSRVHKTSYFQPVVNHFNVSDTIIGTYNEELNLASVKELVEYFWSCGTMNVSYSKVLESEIKEFNDHFEYYIQSILIIYGDFGLHDEIVVYDNFIILNKTDRRLIIKTNKIKTILGIQH
jgi:hypothetical protein